jgi:hypothetical protein
MPLIPVSVKNYRRTSLLHNRFPEKKRATAGDLAILDKLLYDEYQAIKLF